ncbi:MAG: antitoxin family protein [Anaerolineae bacterium]|nr:antitoxin family protein [Anaerolineae bacterium]
MFPQTLEAIYENGALRLLTQPEGLAEHSKVKITIEAEEAQSPSLLQFAGILTDEEAADLIRVIEEEFERIDPNEW